jgi:hypothetical protein
MRTARHRNSLAQPPQSDGHKKPGHCGEQQSDGFAAPWEYQSGDQGEGSETPSSQSGSCSILRDRFAGPAEGLDSAAPRGIALMLFQQGGAGGEDHGKSQEKSGHDRAEVSCDQAGGYIDQPPEHEAYQEFVAVRLSGCCQINRHPPDDSRYRMLNAPAAHSPQSSKPATETSAAGHRPRGITEQTAAAYTMKAPAARNIVRASMDAVATPCWLAVNAKVTRATEGAAPNSPAKLLGLSTSPVRANRLTTNPPIRKRHSSCMDYPRADLRDPRGF